MCAEDGSPLPLVWPVQRLHHYLHILAPKLSFCGEDLHLIVVIVHLQGEQLRGILQLQVFHPLPGLLAGVLSVHRSHRVAVFHQILDGESRRALRHAANSAGDADLFARGSTDKHPVEWVVHGADLSPCFLSPFPSSALLTSLVLPLCYLPVHAH